MSSRSAVDRLVKWVAARFRRRMAFEATVGTVAERGPSLNGNSLVALGLLLARILHLRRVSAFGKDADGIQFLPQA